MAKIIHNIALVLIVMAFASMPSKVQAQEQQKTPVEVEQNAISITCSESTLYVKNADHGVLEVFSITGEKVYTVRIDSPSKTIDLTNLSRGCYIVRIGKYTRKIYIK